jgi:sensor c-di-GMP phosphodiesterase-like protein
MAHAAQANAPVAVHGHAKPTAGRRHAQVAQGAGHPQRHVGYSSLAQLKGFPVDILKVDRSFIRNLPESQRDRAITEAIIAMAKNLSLMVIAEGVETAEQEAFLRDISCDASQGFFFSKPIPADEFALLLQKNNIGHNGRL